MAPDDKLDPSKHSDLLKILESLNLRMIGDGITNVPKKEHKFWNTQPVPQSVEELKDTIEDGPIDKNASIELVRKEPIPLPDNYEFVEVDLENETEQHELYELLSQNYVEDYESLFRFEYPKEFLDWALKPPGWQKSWHVGVRVKDSGKLVAFISAVPCNLRIRANAFNSVEVNFLCIEKKLRSKRLAPVLIKEVTRRVNLQGIFQALYTAGISLPEPITVARYYHRPLNMKKLVETEFSGIPDGKTLDQMINYYKLPATCNLKGFREATDRDIPKICELLQTYHKKFSLVHDLSEDDCRHWFKSIPSVIFPYVLVDENDEATDFISFYSIPSTVLGNDVNPTINVGYIFYYAARDESVLAQMVKAVLIIAKNLGFDVMNCLDIMDNGEFLDSLKFGSGDGCLKYYLYNWKTKLVPAKEMAFVML